MLSLGKSWDDRISLHTCGGSERYFMFLLCNWAFICSWRKYTYEIYLFGLGLCYVVLLGGPLLLSKLTADRTPPEVNYRHGGHLWGSQYVCLRSFGAATTKPLKLQGTWPGKWVLNSLPG